MIFKEKYRVIYCKNDSYNEKYDNDNLYYNDKTSKCYYKGYLVHREDGPAVEWQDGTKWWYLNGKRHRENGPAVEWPDGSKHWYINGKEYSEKEYLKIISLKKKSRVLNDI